MPLAWFYLLLLLQRSGELLYARRNARRLLAKGGCEFFPQSYRTMFALHVGFYLALLLEPHPWTVPWDKLTLFCLVAYLPVQILRYWSIASLGSRWTTRIILIPGSKVVRLGPYRWLRHPNYLAITLEFLIIPLLMRAPWTLLVFTLANLAVLRQRIALEESALREHTDFVARFDGRSKNA